jgi:transposase
MTIAAVEILESTELTITDGFYQFILHHRSQADFCTPAKGKKKSDVENRVDYTRRNMLVSVPTTTRSSTLTLRAPVWLLIYGYRRTRAQASGLRCATN